MTISIHALREEGDLRQAIAVQHILISIHALREEGDTGCCHPVFEVHTISIHALREEGDKLPKLSSEWIKISIHALREEGDRHHPGRYRILQHFYPRPPRGGRRTDGQQPPGSAMISIHALREEGDGSGQFVFDCVYLFLSTPSARRATSTSKNDRVNHLFLSTPSARRATAKTETKSLFSNKLYNILHEFRRALIYNGSKNYPNHAK